MRNVFTERMFVCMCVCVGIVVDVLICVYVVFLCLGCRWYLMDKHIRTFANSVIVCT